MHDIGAKFGFMQTNNLGRYLGMPLVHDCLLRNTFASMLKRVRNKLSGSKADQLSLAERVTFTQSVIQSIPMYTMQTMKLSVSTCDEIDLLVRNFIWGSSDAKKKLHLVNWNKIYHQKNYGGLGLKYARSTNEALLMKF
ncbi:conserved hypothetical protein [Ricinus communis]|uniref:Uncharacterized protein n=1 Tax=Ricinus communis TaxID=3988 RepID=B9SM09_RICCO|nr:conserved hypothetical protein [Ricinus communis]